MRQFECQAQGDVRPHLILARRRRLSHILRAPEQHLGGAIHSHQNVGAKVGQMVLRHKIRKEPFRQQLNGIIAVQIVALAAAFAIAFIAR